MVTRYSLLGESARLVDKESARQFDGLITVRPICYHTKRAQTTTRQASNARIGIKDRDHVQHTPSVTPHYPIVRSSRPLGHHLTPLEKKSRGTDNE
ncbi:unnamed protein product [Ilex paraguariensis]|uniref:Uncharacterized protein n=1 Tax=Ilex paraguariensis TaxID=185542 RepID=A0ABC8UZA6_9AQUA